jgi:plastocyanin
MMTPAIVDTRRGRRHHTRALLIAVALVAPAVFAAGAPAPAGADWILGPAAATGRANGIAVALTDGRILIAGGGSGTNPSDAAEIFDPATNGWAPTASLGDARYGAMATRLLDGRVLVCGGRGALVANLTGCERYDPTLGVWLSAASMPAARYQGTAVTLADGRVFTFGGPTVSTHLYLPATNKWTFPPGLHTARPNGPVAVLLNHAEIYDPITDSWSDGGTFHTGRVFDAMVTVPGGEALLIGGTDGHGGVLSSIELYDPGTNRWYDDGDLSTPRATLTATLVPDGHVLVAAGGAAHLILASDRSPAPVKVAASNFAFTPAKAKAGHMGGFVRWNDTKGRHSVTESDLLGDDGAGHAVALFDSGVLIRHETWDHALLAAGTYHYHSTGDPASMKGTITVPMTAALAADPFVTRFSLRWSASEMAGFEFDVEYRFQPNGSSFGPWTTWSPAGTTGGWARAHALFTPPGAAPGTYQFRSRLRNVATGHAGGWSPAISGTIPA